MKAINRKILTWGAAAITSGSWAYSLAARYTDFLFAPKAEKIAIFSFLIILSCLLSAWLFLVVIRPHSEKDSLAGEFFFLQVSVFWSF